MQLFRGFHQATVPRSAIAPVDVQRMRGSHAGSTFPRSAGIVL
jgi:hypothetical protein